MIGAFLFDVDGTLVDSNMLHAEAWRATFLHFGIDVPLDDVRTQIGKGGDNLIPALLPAEVVARRQEEIDAYRSDLFKNDYLPRARPFPGVRALFERIAGDGRKIVLATSAKTEELDHHLDLLGVRDLISDTTSADDVRHSKPDPDIFRAALAKVAPLGSNDVRVVGDSPYDLAAAGKIGIQAIAFRSGGFADAILVDAGASLLLDGPQDMLRRYDAIFARESV